MDSEDRTLIQRFFSNLKPTVTQLAWVWSPVGPLISYFHVLSLGMEDPQCGQLPLSWMSDENFRAGVPPSCSWLFKLQALWLFLSGPQDSPPLAQLIACNCTLRVTVAVCLVLLALALDWAELLRSLVLQLLGFLL